MSGAVVAAAGLGELTDQQQAFVAAYCSNDAATAGKGKSSAIVAGYAEGSAAQMAAKLLGNPKIVQAIKARGTRAAALHDRAAARAVMIEIMSDPKQPGMVRLKAAEGLYDRAPELQDAPATLNPSDISALAQKLANALPGLRPVPVIMDAQAIDKTE